MFFLIHFGLRDCSYAVNIKPSFSFFKKHFVIHPSMSPHFFHFSYKFTIPWSCFSFHCSRLSFFFCFLAVGPSYSGKILYSKKVSIIFPPTDPDIDKDFVLQFLHSLKNSGVLLHLPFFERAACQCHFVGGTFY